MTDARRDENFVTTLIGVSSVDGETPARVYIDPADNHVLAKSSPTISDSATDFEGAPVTVGTTAVEMTFTGTTKSIFLQSDHDNSSSNVWVGKSNVDNAGANAMARLGQGESLTIELNDSSNAIYVVSDTSSQTVFKMALI